MRNNEKFEACVEVTLRHEGSRFVKHPRDPGGATRWGITKQVLAEWRGVPVDALPDEEVQRLTKEEAKDIYLSRYWNRIRGDDLPRGVDLAVFDFAVNSGVRRASQFVQRIVGVKADGVIGQKTLTAIWNHDRENLIKRLCSDRLTFLRNLPTWNDFKNGWERRVQDIERLSLERARERAQVHEMMSSDTIRAATTISSISVAAGAASSLLSESRAFIEMIEPFLKGSVFPAILVTSAVVLSFGVIWFWKSRRL